MNKYLQAFTWIVLATALVLMLYFFYMAFWPFKMIEFDGQMKVLNEDKQVQRGDNLMINVKFHKFMDVSGEVTRDIRCGDGNRITLSPITSNAPVGENDVMFGVPIPEKTSLGFCTYNNFATYQVNPHRVITTEIASEPFEVID
jgi:hypothetical protein